MHPRVFARVNTRTSLAPHPKNFAFPGGRIIIVSYLQSAPSDSKSTKLTSLLSPHSCLRDHYKVSSGVLLYTWSLIIVKYSLSSVCSYQQNYFSLPLIDFCVHVEVFFPPEVKQPECEAVQSPPSSFQVKTEWIFGSFSSMS